MRGTRTCRAASTDFSPAADILKSTPKPPLGQEGRDRGSLAGRGLGLDRDRWLTRAVRGVRLAATPLALTFVLSYLLTK